VDRIEKTRKSVLRVAASLATLSLAACADIHHTKVGEGEAPVVLGPAVRNNITPLNEAYACYATKLAQNNVHISVGVSDIRDYTGKASDLEGTVVTQGGPMMAYSALGKLKPAVELHERFDTRVAELELAYIDRRQLGTGQTQTVNGQQVPWIPYYGGTIIESDYYLVGGITEVNYNIQSGGFSGSVDLIGPRARTFTLSVGLDLRLVNTKTLVVESTASLQKQIVGYEVGVGIFKFFGDYLVDFDAGVKNQEPVQLGVRTTMELGILQLLGDVTGVFYEDCVSSYFEDPSSFDRSKEGTSDAGAVIQNDAALPLSSGIEGVEGGATGEATVETSSGNLSDAMRQELQP
jgi:curli biogenesis system outer membrane secretion channel CsgG